MSGPTQSDRDQRTYRTFDGRAISRQTIERALHSLETHEQRQERWRRVRRRSLYVLGVIGLIVLCLLLVWWRLGI